jgi:ribose 5-phosphate isomerase B
MKIILASDHAGFELKENIKKFLLDNKYEVEDVGAFTYDENDDYPQYMHKAGQLVAQSGGVDRAIIFGGSGQGEAIVANKVQGVRAAEWYGGNMDIVRLSREHNDANVLSIGARFVSLDEAKKAVELWLKTNFSGEERHKRRIEEI